MPTFLHIDSNSLYGQSVSRSRAFVDKSKSSHPDGTCKCTRTQFKGGKA